MPGFLLRLLEAVAQQIVISAGPWVWAHRHAIIATILVALGLTTPLYPTIVNVKAPPIVASASISGTMRTFDAAGRLVKEGSFQPR